MPRSGAGTRLAVARSEVLDFARAADDAIVAALERAEFDLAGREHAAMADGEAIFTALEHEAMHQETLLYMWRRLPYAHKRKPHDLSYELGAAPPPNQRIDIPAGRATLGARRPSARATARRSARSSPSAGTTSSTRSPSTFPLRHRRAQRDQRRVPRIHRRARLSSGGSCGTTRRWEWREAEQVEPSGVLVAGERQRRRRVGLARHVRGDSAAARLAGYVSQAEASAFARWKGRRLPTEAEFHRAAFGSPDGDEREFPWGAAPPQPAHGNFDFQSWEPVPAGARPAGASAWGVHDLVGNGWEWTASEFAPFPGFTAMASYPEYSAEFFDGQHVVLKGASPATAKELIRRSFRNWFRTNYPYVYAKFRTVSS